MMSKEDISIASIVDEMLYDLNNNNLRKQLINGLEELYRSGVVADEAVALIENVLKKIPFKNQIFSSKEDDFFKIYLLYEKLLARTGEKSKWDSLIDNAWEISSEIFFDVTELKDSLYDDTFYFIFDYANLGDPVLYFSIIAGLKRDGIKVVTITSDKVHRVSRLFLPDEDCVFLSHEKLLNLTSLIGLRLQKLKKGVPCVVYRNYIPGKSFNESNVMGVLNRKMRLNVVEDFLPGNPINTDEETALSKFHDLGLVHNKTVFIAPFSSAINSMYDTNEKLISFYLKINSFFKGIGYEVVFNIYQGRFDKELYAKHFGGLKTTGDLTVAALVPFIDNCGYFVSMRSGIADLALFSKARKVIFYPNKKSLEQFSLDGFLPVNNYLSERVLVNDEFNLEELRLFFEN